MNFRLLSAICSMGLALAGCGVANATPAIPGAAPAAIEKSVSTTQSSPAPSELAGAPQPVAAAAANATEVVGSAAPSASSAPAKPAVPVAPTPTSIRLGPLEYIRQTLNNCGPAAIAEVLKYWGVSQTQEQARVALRPDANSRGMMPYPVPGYLHRLGMDALMGVGGNDTLLKALVSNGFPVIVSQAVSASDRTGHYREIEGFDDARGVYISTDSYLGPNHVISYAEFKQIWTGNQRFMVVYPPAKQALLDAVTTSAGWDKTSAYTADLERPQVPRPGENRIPGFDRAGFSNLNRAWSHIQLGSFDQAKTEIDAAAAQGASAQMVAWLQEALQVSSASQ